MKFIHLSDLHLGKRLNEFPLQEDQEYILKEILGIIDDEAPDGVIIAGDVYDKSIGSIEAVKLLDDFLVSLVKRNIKTYVISGNHDSVERLSYGGRIMKGAGVYLSPFYEGHIECIEESDEYGRVNIYMLPFFKPVQIRKYFPDREINSYTDAVEAAIEEMNIDTSVRNILINHQFVSGASRSDSEDMNVGGVDAVAAEIYKDFDYVALGHIHRPQSLADNIRYAGTPVKYSFSEASHDKTVTVVDMGPKGELNIREIPLKPMRDMSQIRGSFEELTDKAFYEGSDLRERYIRATLTDEEDIPDAMSKLRRVYPYIMTMDYDNSRTRSVGDMSVLPKVDNKSPMEVFSDFYKMRNGAEMKDEYREFMEELIAQVWEEE